MAPVSGQVTLDGNPLANVRVVFQPASAATPGAGSTGVTDAQGHYSLTLMSESAAKGAVPGKHIVTISQESEGDQADDAGAGQGGSLPPKAGDGSLTFEVPAQGTDAANFQLTSK